MKKRMMARKEKPSKPATYSLLIVPNTGSPPKTLVVSRRTLVRALVLTLVLVVLALTAVVDYWQSRYDLARVEKLKTENRAQQKALDNLARKVQELEERNDKLRKQQEEIKKLMGVSLSAGTTQPTPSRGGIRYSSSIIGDKDLLALLALVSEMDQILRYQEAEANRLLDEVRKRTEYYRRLPNLWPVVGEVTSPFGWRKSPFSRRKKEFHNGLDIAADWGTPVRAAGDGRVVYVGWKPGYGRVVQLEHGNGLITWYAHNSKILVKKGDAVKKGDVIARVGSSGRSTGSHLHYVIEYQGKPVDPCRYLP